MPNMANIVVKDASNTDRTYTAAAPSSGDKTPAVWTRNDVSAQLNRRPRVTTSTRNSGGTLPARIQQINFTAPIVETVNGADVVTGTYVFNGTVTIPTNCDSTKVNDANVQCTNVVASTLFRSVVAEGFAPS